MIIFTKSQHPHPYSTLQTLMEPLSPPSEKRITIDHSSTVDTSRPFRSVKEAVVLFSERFLAGDIYTNKAYTSSRDDEHALGNTLKKIEAELEETKRELKLLKEKESETEIALASLNAELHKNMSKMAQAEATAAAAMAKAVTTRTLVVGENREDDIIEEEEEREKDPIVRTQSSVTIAQLLSHGEQESYYHGITKKQKKMMKKKPIIPLVGDLLFSRKKGSSTTLHNPLYSSSIV
ncbi:WEB family protein At1g75720-like [Telopea speciosissima]|uniref:WEB family protein At1g75720-like n=1 Tax=Telopea speciosissima TaxID=54955 RepID=UPI001CC648A1|nr:WEB family protein At1g75720-like [Telopea speciosissima]